MIITQSAAIRQLISLAKKIAISSAPVLITGESGTGKELFADLIHNVSTRSSGPFIQVNCAALSPNLIESELFGHEKGAFTDASSSRQGRFELANHGTLFLDEISEMPLASQAKLLRVLESNSYERVGGKTTIRHDVRVIGASNCDLRDAVQSGTFRLDLFHRVNVLAIHIPPLRDRIDDVPLLATHFLKQFQNAGPVVARGFTSRAIQKLVDYHWPGNVRELRNVVHRACVLTETPELDDELLECVHPETRPASPTIVPEPFLEKKLADIERLIILESIKRFKNHRTVATRLGITTRTLSNKLKTYREMRLQDATLEPQIHSLSRKTA